MSDTPPKLSFAQMGAGIFTLLAGPAVGSLLGSYTGNRGTVIGAAVGSVIVPMVLGWLFLRAAYHARNRLAKVPWRKTKPWHVALAAPALAAVVFVVAMGGLSGVEASVLHKSLSAAVTGSKTPGGSTLGSVLDNAPRPAPTGLEPSEATPAPSLSGTVTLSAPASSPASPTASPVPPAPVSPSPSVTPVLPAPSAGAQGGGGASSTAPPVTPPAQGANQ